VEGEIWEMGEILKMECEWRHQRFDCFFFV